MINKLSLLLILLLSISLILSSSVSKPSLSSKPLVISSAKFQLHSSSSFHPENPDRIKSILPILQQMHENNNIRLKVPLAEDYENSNDKKSYNSIMQEALNVIKKVHSEEYIRQVKGACEAGAKTIGWEDQDTYINEDSFKQVVMAQSAWLEVTKEVHSKDNIAFACTRPPGHHAIRTRSMGFCIFNFAVGAAVYALDTLKMKRVAILDFDVHYGNGVADLISSNSNIRYASIHEHPLFPFSGKTDVKGDHQNILNIIIESGTKIEEYEKLLVNEAIPWLKDFNADILIVCAGYDALASDDLSNVMLLPNDYCVIAKHLKDNFGNKIVFGLEGGYNVVDLPYAIRETIMPFTNDAN